MKSDKELLEKAEKLHDIAMSFMDLSAADEKRGDLSCSYHHKHQALSAEEAAAITLQDTTLEPSRSILFRSSAAIALDIKCLDRALDLAEEGLHGRPPSWVMGELLEIMQKAQEMKRNQNEDRDKYTGSGR